MILPNYDLWKQRLTDFIQFVKVNRRFPSKYSEDKTEASLGSWMNKQKIQRNKNKRIFRETKYCKIFDDFLEKNKKFDINKNIKNYENKIKELQNFVDEYNYLPSENADDLYEKSLGNFIKSSISRTNNKKNSLKKKKIQEFCLANMKYFIQDEDGKFHIFRNKEYILKKVKDDMKNLTDFLEQNNRLPRKENTSEKELNRSLRAFYRNYRKKKGYAMIYPNFLNEFGKLSFKYSNIINNSLLIEEYDSDMMMFYNWENGLIKIKEHILKYKSFPTKFNFNRLYCWFKLNWYKYEKREGIYKEDNIYFKTFTKFWNDFGIYCSELKDSKTITKIDNYLQELINIMLVEKKQLSLNSPIQKCRDGFLFIVKKFTYFFQKQGIFKVKTINEKFILLLVLNIWNNKDCFNESHYYKKDFHIMILNFIRIFTFINNGGTVKDLYYNNRKLFFSFKKLYNQYKKKQFEWNIINKFFEEMIKNINEEDFNCLNYFSKKSKNTINKKENLFETFLTICEKVNDQKTLSKLDDSELKVIKLCLIKYNKKEGQEEFRLKIENFCKKNFKYFKFINNKIFLVNRKNFESKIIDIIKLLKDPSKITDTEKSNIKKFLIKYKYPKQRTDKYKEQILLSLTQSYPKYFEYNSILKTIKPCF